MSDVATLHAGAESQETPLTPENWGKLGMWLFLAGDAMSFGCLIVGYGILRHASKNWPVPSEVLGILIHGDAAFPGQGIVAETLNLSRLTGWDVGGTIHIIANNQLGFTADPHESFSTSYASGLARGFKIPIVHVNADDPVACIEAARLSWAYRQRFQLDFLIDLVGYRRHGHNEGDEPAFTQPQLYQRVSEHPTVRQQYAEALVASGVVPATLPDELVAKLKNEARVI